MIEMLLNIPNICLTLASDRDLRLSDRYLLLCGFLVVREKGREDNHTSGATEDLTRNLDCPLLLLWLNPTKSPRNHVFADCIQCTALTIGALF